MNSFMKVSDGRKLPVVPGSTNLRQPAGPEKFWQDSAVLVWWDLENNVGGYHRIGHEPNLEEGPKIALWNNLVTPEGVYKNSEVLPLTEADKLDNGGFGAGPTCRYEYLDNEHIWTIEDGNVKARISHKDVHPCVECYPKDSSVSEDFANVHVDLAGKVSGYIEMEGKRYEINGLSFRDKGWGNRVWDTLLSHRWCVGTFEQDFSFLALSWYDNEENIATFGWAVKGEEIVYAKSVDILSYIEVDGTSNRGGKVSMELTDGSSFEAEFTPVTRPIISIHHGICCVDTLCEVRCGDLVGIGDFESTANIQAGTRNPTKFSEGLVDNRFYPTAELA